MFNASESSLTQGLMLLTVDGDLRRVLVPGQTNCVSTSAHPASFILISDVCFSEVHSNLVRVHNGGLMIEIVINFVSNNTLYHYICVIKVS